jgi:hypothetical protein
MMDATLAAQPPEYDPIDRARVDLSEDQEFRYWTARFACTPEQLVVALKIVGVSAAAVDQFLRAPGREVPALQTAGKVGSRRSYSFLTTA